MDETNKELFKLLNGMFNQNSLHNPLEEQSKIAYNLAQKINEFPENVRQSLQNFATYPSDQVIQENPEAALEYVKYIIFSPNGQNNLSNAYLITNAVENNLSILENRNYPLAPLFDSLAEIYGGFLTLTGNQLMVEKSGEYSAKAYEYGSKSPMAMMGYINKNFDKFKDYYVFQIKEEPIYKDMIKAALEDESGILAFLLGLLLKGNGGSKENRKEALRWFKYANNCGLLEATCEVALYFLETGFLQEDFTIGLNLLEYAASKNYSEALYLLGCCYKGGQVVKKNKKKAREYFQKAVALGHVDAINSLNTL